MRIIFLLTILLCDDTCHQIQMRSYFSEIECNAKGREIVDDLNKIATEEKDPTIKYSCTVILSPREEKAE